ncbi:hypothetical protein L596_024550 [Steinernema carpocapsae]|uniref:RNA polymerase II-associated protein 3 n=1 Tax=Steinernema carpocapsae TaxID=34508 RepID=A0A4U5MH20_STECR|nr:hypothetical protein L596_024550 [Steinernema carpocapsae]
MSADELRKRGNEFFKESKFHNAIKTYTESLEIAVSTLTLANRAQAHLNLGHNESAYADADAAVLADDDYAKARYRRALAALKLGFRKRAKRDCDILLKEDPKNSQFLKLQEDIQNAKTRPTIDLCHVNKCETIRSREPLKEAAIEQNEALPEEEAKLPEEAEPSKNAFRVPLPANSGNQFRTDFNLMKSKDPMYFGSYMLSMDVQRLPAILDTFIDGDILGLMIRGLCAVATSVPKDRIVEILVNVSLAPRFDLAAMFLDGKDKKILEDLLLRLPKESEELLRRSYL